MIRRILLVVSVVVFAFAFTACGGDDSEDSGNTGDTGNTVGDTGNTGNTGGDTGDTGNTGGDTGNTGGDTGNTSGDTGNTGGDTGNTGGDTGDTGNTGGDTGDTGNTGGGDVLECDGLSLCLSGCGKDDACRQQCVGRSYQTAVDEYNAIVDCYTSNGCDKASDPGQCLADHCSAQTEQCNSHHPADYPTVGASCYQKGDIAHNIMYYDANWKFHQFADYYKTKKAILFIISGISCPACKSEAAELPGVVNDLGADKVAILEVIIGSDNYLLGVDDLADWDDTYGGTFTGSPSTNSVGAYLDPSATSIGTPYNVFIDGDTMEVLDIVEGGFSGADLKAKLQGIINN